MFPAAHGVLSQVKQAGNGPPPTGISFVGVTTDRQGGVSAIRDVPKPPGATEGDLLFVLFGGTDNSYTQPLTPPDGWTQLERVTYTPVSGAGFRMALFTKTAGASEPATYEFNTNSNNSTMQWVSIAYRGAALTDTTSSLRTTAGDSNPFGPPALDVPADGWWAGGWSGYSAREFTPESGLSDRTKGTNRVAWSDLSIPAGATGVTKQATPSGTTRMAAFGIALEPS